MDSPTTNDAGLNNAAVIIIGGVSGPVARALTGLIRRTGRISGEVQTKTVSAALSALVAGAGGYLSGTYGTGWPGLSRAVIAAGVAYFTATGTQAAAEHAAASAASKELP